MEIYLVGGAVRDKLLGLDVDECDYVVVGASPQELLDKGFIPVGKDFPVFLHPDTRDEYALARTERKSGRGYKGFECYAAPDVTLEEDLERRDLTVNAIAKDSNGNLIDPYGGIEDLNRRILRHVSPAFSEDPLRVLRAARFTARFHHLGFSVAAETLKLMEDMATSGELDELTAERVWQEFSRSLTGPDPEIFFATLHKVGALAPLLDLPLPKTMSWPSLERYSPDTSQLDEAYSVWVWDLFQQVDEPAYDKLHARLRVPNHCRDLANIMRDSATHLTGQTDAESILALLRRADAWRKPERFMRLLSVLKTIKVTDDEEVQVLQQAFQQCANIDVQEIIAQGYTGRQISEQLTAQRLRSVQQLLTSRGG